jgi:replicative superfamily II helicase
MGLNLNIRKVIFFTTYRQTNTGTIELEDHEIQQIAGRAGRGKETGYVQCANLAVLKRVQ